jgi:hypothetical protein
MINSRRGGGPLLQNARERMEVLAGYLVTWVGYAGHDEVSPVC